MMAYNIPYEISRIIKLFHQNRLTYNLFKCEHIFWGENKNFDILFETDADYTAASKILEKEGYALYLPEHAEKYKRMYTLFRNGVVTRIHLHRKIAWHGLIALNKRPVFSRAIKIKELVVPSKEDQLVIHAAHVLFEDFYLKERTLKCVNRLLKEKEQLDWVYINKRLKTEKILDAFYCLLDCIEKKRQPNKSRLYLNFVKKVMHTPSSWQPLASKLLRIVLRKIDLRRNGTLIVFIGVNGSGKTTIANKTLEAYYPLSRTVNGQFGYYFGWYPFSFFSKVLSAFLKDMNIKIFYKMNEQEDRKNTMKNKKKSGNIKIKKLNNKHSGEVLQDKSSRQKSFRPFNELFFLYNYFEYLLRYFFEIRPRLMKNKLVVADRFFYDVYGQYKSSERSVLVWLLMRLFPKPDYLFVLDANIKTLIGRDKNISLLNKSISSSSRAKKRDVHPIEDLEGQRRRYSVIQDYFRGIRLNTEEDMDKNIEKVIKRTWRSVVGPKHNNF